VPERDDLDGVIRHVVVEVVANPKEMESAYSGQLEIPGGGTYLRLGRDELEPTTELGAEQVWGRGSVRLPPESGLSDLSLGVRDDSEPEAHRSAERIQKLPAVDAFAATALLDRFLEEGALLGSDGEPLVRFLRNQ
jgi:hypothetical protein